MQIVSSGGLSKEEIAKMQEDAEQYAEEDRMKRESAEAKNSADSTIWGVENALEEHGDNIPDDLKKELNDGVDELRNAISGDDSEQIKELTEKLQKAQVKIGDHLYKNTSSEQQNDDSEQGGEEKKEDEATMDAEYEEAEKKEEEKKN